MREMKNSGIEWIGEIPNEWLVGRVKYIFTRKNEKAMQEAVKIAKSLVDISLENMKND